MPTIFDKAIRFTAGAHKAVVAAHALINTMSVWTYWMMLRTNGASPNTLVGKGNASAGLWISQSIDNRIFTRLQRDGSVAAWVPSDGSLPQDNAWRWLVLSHDAATGILTQRAGVRGGPLTTRFTGASGSGALTADDAFALSIGGSPSVNGGFDTEWGFLAVSNTVPSDAVAAAVVADPLAYTGFVGGWKPEAGHTTTIPNIVIADPARPPMVLTGATIVDGPDDPPPLDPPVFDGIEIVTNPNTGPITEFPHLLDTIVVRPIDQYGDPWTGTVPADGAIPANHCSALALGLPYVLGGTTMVALSGGVWTFSDLIALDAADVPTLAAPTLTADGDSLTLFTRVVPFTAASSGAAYPSGATVQLQTRRGSAAFANQAAPFAVASSRSLTFTRESASYDVQIRGIASASGATSSAPGGVLTLTIPALPTITPGTTAMPLRATVTLFPATSEALTASSSGAIPTLNARSRSDHILRLTNISEEPALGGAPVEPDAVRYTVSDSAGVLLGPLPFPTPATEGDWRLVLPRTLFDPSRGSLTLDLALVAPDESETALQFILAQGVRQ
jgi:hypothetical protein